MNNLKISEKSTLVENINSAIASLGCIVNQDNADDIREAIKVLCECKANF